MTEKRKSPALRFRGYTDDWEQRKLSHFLDVSSEKNTDNLYTKDDVLSVSGDFGVINQIEFQGRSFAGASVSNYGVVHTGDVVYTKSPLKANPYGIIKANKGKTGIVSVLYGVYHTRENANADFIQMYFEQDTRLNNYLRPLVNKGAKNTLLISDTDALEGEVCLAPTFDEQKTIGQFFDTLDNLITLHQRKLEKLKLVKKSMLEKMFPKNGSSVPEIRFNGFTDDWEQRKFNDIATRESAVRKSSPDCPSIEYEDVVAEAGILNKDIRLKDSEKNGIIFDGSQVLYGKLRPYLHNWHNPDFEGVAVGDWWVLKPIHVDKSFLYRLIQTQKFDDIANQSSGSKMPRADWNLVSNSEFSIPPLIDEQVRIGTYFNDLDNLITLHQRKLEKLKLVKKSMLEKMFPKNGSSVPEIRFKGFTDDWEQRKLGDVVQITMGQSPDGSTYSDEPSDYILVQGNADLQNGWVCPRIWTTQITKKVDAGDLIMSVRAPAGAMGKTAYNAVIGRGVAAIKGNEFIYQLLVKMDTDGFWKTLSCGSTFESLNSDNIKNAEVKIPTTAEQIKIGGFFQYLDNLITLHQRKVEKLKILKKSMLEKMFV